jgi:hypothetical protein
MPQPAKASEDAVQQAVDALLEEGTPLDRITVQAVRERVGGGSNTSVSRHLRPYLEANRAELADHQADILEGRPATGSGAGAGCDPPAPGRRQGDAR